ncbi:MAG: biotin--[acetyl-CoA-carboxylase] ligase [Candidatus Competibacterales bacterium]|nr:biotin--[acetyl-CoA-carboxylase] ligase [Candidatus Competibacterales bacterium]
MTLPHPEPAPAPPNTEALRAALTPAVRHLLGPLEWLAEVDSTNARLLAAADRGLAGGAACLADAQSAGRGRQGRRWISPPGGNLYLSLLWRYHRSADLQGLSVATGIAVARALHALGATGVGLKWPNDLLHDGRKLGGILLESRTGADRPVVAGIGLNLDLPDAAAVSIDQPWTDLRRVLGAPVLRLRVAARLLERLLPLYADWPAGAHDLSASWRRFDVLADRRVELCFGDRRCAGIARGIDPTGALRLETATGLQVFDSGELSLRPLS